MRQIRNQPRYFPETITMLDYWGQVGRAKWIELVKRTYKSQEQPEFWVSNYLGPGGGNIVYTVVPEELNVEIEHIRGGAKYDFGAVVEGGRPSYDMKQYLYSSHKTRIVKETGERYLWIPIDTNEEPNVILRINSQYREPSVNDSSGKTMVLRNRYDRFPVSRLSPGSRNNVVQFQQVDRLGVIHASNIELRIMKESSTGWIHRPITGVQYSKMTEQMIKSGNAKVKYGKSHMSFDQAAAAAVSRDFINYLNSGEA